MFETIIDSKVLKSTSVKYIQMYPFYIKIHVVPLKSVWNMINLF
jgi:hypothetical protein